MDDKHNTSVIRDGFWNKMGANYNHGPCGIPKSIFGTSPYVAGAAALQEYCNSNAEDCTMCPLNPNTKK